jgi:hypothetical protein
MGGGMRRSMSVSVIENTVYASLRGELPFV